MIESRYPVGFSVTVTDRDETETFTITAYATQTASELVTRNNRPLYVIRSSSGTRYLATHEFMKALVELAEGDTRTRSWNVDEDEVWDIGGHG